MLLTLFPATGDEQLQPGAILLRGFVTSQIPALHNAVAQIAAVAPFRRMATPGGWPMSVAMTNCGTAGWITDRRGYRYTATDPLTEQPWPPMPGVLASLASRAAAAAGYQNFAPDACLINHYEPGAKMSLHQDRDERNFAAPIVSLSLGLPATFLWSGLTRTEKPRRLALASGDVVVWGGESRLNFHGILPLPDGSDPIFGRRRINITFREAL